MTTLYQLSTALFFFFFLACTTVKPVVLPTVTAEEFQLDILANWGQFGSGTLLPIRHRLINNSSLSVCVGGFQAFRVSGRRVQTRIVKDALCDSPLAVVPPGGAIEWTVEWHGPPDCVAEAEVSSDFAEKFPGMICGNQVDLESEISVYRVYGGLPQWGSTNVVSTVQHVRLNPPKP